MSSRFVSGGTIAAGETEASSSSHPSAPAPVPDVGSKSAEWEKVQQHLEAERRQRQEARAQAAASSGEGERSLYDVLQANKAAREAATAEAAKLTNQFRALDDDEVAFLDEVATRRRQAEESVRRETEDQLEAFRKAARKGLEGGGEVKAEDEQEEGWVTRKRKRKTEKDGGGGVLVRRKVSVGEEVKKERDKQEEKEKEKHEKVEKIGEKGSSKTTALALADYGSDSDE
ncbi:NEFA-interacting nuclear protein NIP3 [Cordyceps militaris CM01]|uniref:NEFA-interacting nuclear protein NIP3 n=1 Tax=Cordyceps militaris (strain CM01) TaxID=983644 RepID=G3JLN1_CORMM|nr:NEFA-interacting nuclear protein NIP3 [Cordyceps militaris CM01]EGX90605.1 NEFA-interacting nuclear protein NIP3 [Cordyceps militaris CM01]